MRIKTKFGDPVNIGEYGVKVREAVLKISSGEASIKGLLHVFRINSEEYTENKNVKERRIVALQRTQTLNQKAIDKFADLKDEINWERAE